MRVDYCAWVFRSASHLMIGMRKSRTIRRKANGVYYFSVFKRRSKTNSSSWLFVGWAIQLVQKCLADTTFSSARTVLQEKIAFVVVRSSALVSNRRKCQ